jgi:hypothetical protein
MPSTKRRTYTQDTIDAIAQRFDAAPPSPQTRTEKGYSWQAIATMMADSGVTLSPNVLRKYAAAKPDNAKTKKRTRGGSGSLASRPRAVPRLAGVPAAAAADHVTAPDDAWEDLEPVEETELAPADALAGTLALASTPPAVRSESAKSAPSSSVRSSPFRTHPDAASR